ncbi:MAG: hypothetical protein ABR583_07140 [Gaiellaceae bacterium]
MGLTDVLFGRKKLKQASGDKIFALATATVTLETELGLTSAGAAGVVFKALSAESFVRAENELDELLQVAATESRSRIERKTDDHGFEWLVVRDDEFEDLIGTVHLVARELVDRGFGDRLLAAVFRFKGGDHPVYWIYGFKRGAFWPFIPTGGNERDNANELELKAKLENELPVEEDLARWFGLFDAPL